MVEAYFSPGMDYSDITKETFDSKNVSVHPRILLNTLSLDAFQNFLTDIVELDEVENKRHPGETEEAGYKHNKLVMENVYTYILTHLLAYIHTYLLICIRAYYRGRNACRFCSE